MTALKSINSINAREMYSAVGDTHPEYGHDTDSDSSVNPLNAELNPIRHFLALVGARHIVHVSRIRVNIATRLLAG